MGFRFVAFAGFLQSGSELRMVGESVVDPGPHVRQWGQQRQQPITSESEASSSPILQQRWSLEGRLQGELSQPRLTGPSGRQTDRHRHLAGEREGGLKGKGDGQKQGPTDRRGERLVVGAGAL